MLVNQLLRGVAPITQSMCILGQQGPPFENFWNRWAWTLDSEMLDSGLRSLPKTFLCLRPEKCTFNFVCFFVPKSWSMIQAQCPMIPKCLQEYMKQAYIPIQKIIRTSKQSASTSWHQGITITQPHNYGDLCFKRVIMKNIYQFPRSHDPCKVHEI